MAQKISIILVQMHETPKLAEIHKTVTILCYTPHMKMGQSALSRPQSERL